ncbi:DEAD/DEAH box helicase [Streptomyces sp. AC1-42W]|uniref:DEAD/DEAH box helicase n=2 Tax=unclassified Streptomyces TaxID=2593676 RepID=UPI00406D0EA6
MQCGPIRHEIADASAFARHLIVHPTSFTTDEPGNDGASFQAIYSELAANCDCNTQIAADIADASRRGRCSLALSNRVEHLHQLATYLAAHSIEPLLLHGGMPPTERARVRTRVADEMTTPPVPLAIGKLAGEGFDAPRLDTLFLTSPVSFKGRVIQQVGRIMRNTETKKPHVEARDYLDADVPWLERMHHKREPHPRKPRIHRHDPRDPAPVARPARCPRAPPTGALTIRADTAGGRGAAVGQGPGDGRATARLTPQRHLGRLARGPSPGSAGQLIRCACGRGARASQVSL